MSLWTRWVRFTGRRVDARPLQLVMTCIPLCILGDTLAMAWRGALPAVLYATEHGGISDLHHPSLLLGDAAWVGPTLLGTMVAASLLVLAGRRVAGGRLLRPALLTLMVTSAQFGHFYVPGDRGIDRLLRMVLLLLLLSEVSSPRRAAQVAAWPADLLRLLLALVYFVAGVAKIGAKPGWTDLTTPELYTIVAQPMVGRLDPMTWYGHPTPFLLGGVFTLVLELSSVLLITRWGRHWALLGAALHVGLVFTMELGMFPFAMLAFYPVLLSPWTERMLDRCAPWLPAGWGPPQPVTSGRGVQGPGAAPAPLLADATPADHGADERSR